jgi:hypothetical protein
VGLYADHRHGADQHKDDQPNDCQTCKYIFHIVQNLKQTSQNFPLNSSISIILFILAFFSTIILHKTFKLEAKTLFNLKTMFNI